MIQYDGWPIGFLTTKYGDRSLQQHNRSSSCFATAALLTRRHSNRTGDGTPFVRLVNISPNLSGSGGARNRRRCRSCAQSRRPEWRTRSRTCRAPFGSTHCSESSSHRPPTQGNSHPATMTRHDGQCHFLGGHFHFLPSVKFECHPSASSCECPTPVLGKTSISA